MSAVATAADPAFRRLATPMLRAAGGGGAASAGRAAMASRGALLTPDFDAPAEAAPRSDPEAEAAARDAQLAAARARGFEEGEAAGRAAAIAEARAAREAAEAAALAAIAEALAGAEAAARDAVAEVAAALGRLLIEVLDASLPAAAARLAPDTAAMLAETVRPVLEHVDAVTVFVAPGLAAAAAARIGAGDGGRLAVQEDPALAPGDARATWRHGAATTLLEDRRRAVAGVLAALGLTEGEAA